MKSIPNERKYEMLAFNGFSLWTLRLCGFASHFSRKAAE